jgi:hypothetical protein
MSGHTLVLPGTVIAKKVMADLKIAKAGKVARVRSIAAAWNEPRDDLAGLHPSYAP